MVGKHGIALTKNSFGMVGRRFLIVHFTFCVFLVTFYKILAAQLFRNDGVFMALIFAFAIIFIFIFCLKKNKKVF